MELTQHQLTINLTVKELQIWMAALRLAAKEAMKTPIIPWDSCPFYRQHEQLVKLTGYGNGDHIALGETLSQGRAPRDLTVKLGG